VRRNLQRQPSTRHSLFTMVLRCSRGWL
jgi:hypothetical protein